MQECLEMRKKSALWNILKQETPFCGDDKRKLFKTY